MWENVPPFLLNCIHCECNSGLILFFPWLLYGWEVIFFLI
jgi:hypothetical protein